MPFIPTLNPILYPHAHDPHLRHHHYHYRYHLAPRNPPPRRNPRRARTSLPPLCTLHPEKQHPQTPPTPSPPSNPPLQRRFHTFKWRGHSINYKIDGPESALPVLLIHGFGASINHWRKNIPALANTSRLRVYAIDLLGFGASDKPPPTVADYGIPLWNDLVCDFIREMGPQDKWCLVGNSIGSLVAMNAACEIGPDRVRGLALMNCAGGLVSFRYSELNPFQATLLRMFNTILFNPWTGPSLFRNFRKRENVAQVLKQVYIDQTAITDELLDILCLPGLDDGACDVFLAILNADAGPTPEDLLTQLTWCPMLVLWGDKDPWTPLKEGFHPGIKFPHYHPGLQLEVIANAGHCIHDECPQIVNDLMIPFLLEPALKNLDDAAT